LFLNLWLQQSKIHDQYFLTHKPGIRPDGLPGHCDAGDIFHPEYLHHPITLYRYPAHLGDRALPGSFRHGGGTIGDGFFAPGNSSIRWHGTPEIRHQTHVILDDAGAFQQL